MFFTQFLKETLITGIKLKSDKVEIGFQVCKKEKSGIIFYNLDFRDFSQSYLLKTWENKEVEPVLYVFKNPCDAYFEKNGKEIPITVLNEQEILDEVDSVMCYLKEEW